MYERYENGDPYPLQRFLFLNDTDEEIICRYLNNTPNFVKHNKYTPALAFIRQQQRNMLPEIRYELEQKLAEKQHQPEIRFELKEILSELKSQPHQDCSIS